MSIVRKICFLTIMLVLNTQVNCDGNTYSVTDYGAVSDGETDNTRVFLKFKWSPNVSFTVRKKIPLFL